MNYDLHSRLVTFLKITLPLVALALLSTLFLLSRRIDPEAAIPYAEVDIAERVREPRVTAPAWAGVTQDGAALTVTAAEARPGGDGQNATASGLHAVLDMRGGAVAEVKADMGAMDSEGQMLTLSGSVSITSTTGWHVATDRLISAMDRTRMESPGPVTAIGPAGTLSAGTMVLSPASAPGQYAMHFNGGVRLIYHPPMATADGP